MLTDIWMKTNNVTHWYCELQLQNNSQQIKVKKCAGHRAHRQFDSSGAEYWIRIPTISGPSCFSLKRNNWVNNVWRAAGGRWRKVPLNPRGISWVLASWPQLGHYPVFVLNYLKTSQLAARSNALLHHSLYPRRNVMSNRIKVMEAILLLTAYGTLLIFLNKVMIFLLRAVK